MKHVRWFGFAIIALVLAAGCGSATNASASAASSAGSAHHGMAQASQLGFSATTLEGTHFSGSSLAGKPAVLWFWAPWCPTCQAEAPGIAHAARANPRVMFVGVAALDQLPAMRQFVTKYHLGSLPQLADLDGAVWRHFGVTQQPAFAFIKADGTVDVVKGALTQQQLTQRVTQLAGT